MTREKARLLRNLIEKSSVSLSDSDALNGVELFPSWKPDTDYVKNDRVREGENLYKLIPDTHHSQEDWPPHLTPAIWKLIDDPAIEWPEWRQPQGAHDAYPYGAKVSHNGKHWISELHENVYEPGVYGWEEQA